MALQPSSHGTIAIETVGAQSSNDLSFSVKIQPKSVFEILVLAMPHLPSVQLKAIIAVVCRVSEARSSAQMAKP
jgi:hypothetical protein